VVTFEQIELAQLDRGGLRLDRQGERPEFHVSDRLPVHFGDAERVARVVEL
jgi:hypothetical protein